jgi:hypothetical protein
MSLQRQFNRKAAAAKLTEYIQSQPKIDFDTALEPGKVSFALYRHDDGCPTLKTQCLHDCRCSPTVAFHAS